MKALLVSSLVLLDQFSKAHFQYHFELGQSFKVIPGIFHLTYHHNTGAAFGLFQNDTLILSAVSVLFVIWATLYLIRAKRKSIHPVALQLVLAGAIGNGIDRVRLGYVVDFIDLRVWPIFNIADSCITIGVIWMIVHSFLTRKARA